MSYIYCTFFVDTFSSNLMYLFFLSQHKDYILFWLKALYYTNRFTLSIFSIIYLSIWSRYRSWPTYHCIFRLTALFYSNYLTFLAWYTFQYRIGIECGSIIIDFDIEKLFLYSLYFPVIREGIINRNFYCVAEKAKWINMHFNLEFLVKTSIYH